MVDFARIISKTPNRYARGWHCFGLERTIKQGEVTAFEVFGTELVAFRGEDGAIRVFDAYCPHMGANLANGTVKGNTLECPFHSWQWGDGGYCEKIPYCDKIPPKARIRQWECMVENELLFVWHDHEGLPPLAEQRIPPHRCCQEANWSDWVVLSKPANTNCRELIDNLADVYHFEPVHGSPVSSYLNISQGHTYCQMLTGGNQLIGTGDSLRSIAYYYGPSYVIADMEAEMWGHKLECIMMIGNVPITQDRFMMHFGMKVRALDNLSFSENQKLIAEYIANGQETFFQDLRIWDNKKRVDNPILCGGDGPVYQLREWYEQFYLDRDQVPAKTAEKRVFISREREDTAQWLMDVHGVDFEGQPVSQQDALLAPSDA